MIDSTASRLDSRLCEEKLFSLFSDNSAPETCFNRIEMPLPLVRRCCGCFSLEIGVYSLCLLSTVACLANIVAGAWNLPNHRQREPEDNYLSMSMVMFSSLSTVSNLVASAGAYLRRPSYLQLSLLFNMIFIACIFLIAVVTCIFSPELKRSQFLDSPGNVTLVVIMMLVGVVYTVYYLSVINAFYRSIKDDYESAIPI